MTEKPYAHTGLWWVKLLLSKGLQFPSEHEAEAFLSSLKEEWTLSRASADLVGAVELWVRGFKLSVDDVGRGQKGNFVRLRKSAPGNEACDIRWSIERKPLNVHPQRRRPKHDHPDLGHPIFRAALNGRRYRTIAHVKEELATLARDYPKVAIPMGDVLLIMVYSKRFGSPPTRGYVLSPQAAEGGDGFLLSMVEQMEDEVPADFLESPVVDPHLGELDSAGGTGQKGEAIDLSSQDEIVGEFCERLVSARAWSRKRPSAGEMQVDGAGREPRLARGVERSERKCPACECVFRVAFRGGNGGPQTRYCFECFAVLEVSPSTEEVRFDGRHVDPIRTSLVLEGRKRMLQCPRCEVRVPSVFRKGEECYAVCVADSVLLVAGVEA